MNVIADLTGIKNAKNVLSDEIEEYTRLIARLETSLNTYANWTGADNDAYRAKANELCGSVKRMLTAAKSFNTIIDRCMEQYDAAKDTAIKAAKKI